MLLLYANVVVFTHCWCESKILQLNKNICVAWILILTPDTTLTQIVWTC